MSSLCDQPSPQNHLRFLIELTFYVVHSYKKNLYKGKELLRKQCCFSFVLCTHIHATSMARESEQRK